MGSSRPAVLVLVLMLASSACAASVAPRSERVRVVAGFYPLAFAARAVGGDRVVVRDMTPPGVEPHDLELTLHDVDEVQDADVAIVLGGGMQPALEAAAARRRGATLRVFDHLPSAVTATGDPHVWLDPLLMRDVVDAVRDELLADDPSGASTYRAHARGVDRSLAELDAAFRAGLARCERKTVVTSHEAFGHLARRYGLRQVGIAGLSPEVEPDPRRLAELADLVHRTGITTVFTEELVSPRTAEALARTAHIRVEVLSTLESAPTTRGADYLTVMRADLTRLRAALSCD